MTIQDSKFFSYLSKNGNSGYNNSFFSILKRVKKICSFKELQMIEGDLNYREQKPDSNSNSPVCPICGSTNTKLFEKKPNYYKCSQCTCIFVYPVKEQIDYLNNITYLTDPEDYIKAIDPKGFIYLLDKFDTLYQSKINKNKGNLLEIGAGVGYFLIQSYARGWNVEGIETSKEAANWANKYLKMDVKNTTIEKFITTKKYDSVVMIEVLEHLLNPKKALSIIKGICHYPALIFITTPNASSDYWNDERNIYDSNDHIILFSKKSIETLFKNQNIRTFTIEYFGGDKGDAHLMVSAIIHR